MASVRSQRITYWEGGVLLAAYRIEMTQLESLTAGTLRFSMVCTDWEIASNEQQRSYEIAADYGFTQILYRSENVKHSVSVTAEIPNEYADRGIYIKWGGLRNGYDSTVTPMTAFCKSRSLALNLSEGVNSAAVECISSAVRTGALTDGGIVYDGDVLIVSAEAAMGYALDDFDTEITVSGDTVITVSASPMATLHAFFSDWALMLWQVWHEGAWRLYQAHIFKDGSWEKYY